MTVYPMLDKIIHAKNTFISVLIFLIDNRNNRKSINLANDTYVKRCQNSLRNGIDVIFLQPHELEQAKPQTGNP